MHRGSRFPDVGAEEFVHNRILDTMFTNETGHDGRFVLTNLTVVLEGLTVLAHLPFKALYADETILQVHLQALQTRTACH